MPFSGGKRGAITLNISGILRARPPLGEARQRFSDSSDSRVFSITEGASEVEPIIITGEVMESEGWRFKSIQGLFTQP